MPAKSRKTSRAPSRVPYLTWEADRPRWVPGKHLREAGWRAVILRDARDAYLDAPAAVARAIEINAVVAQHAVNGQVPEWALPFSPKLAKVTKPAPSKADHARTVGALLDAYLDCTAPIETVIRENTVRSRRSKLNVLLKHVAELRGEDLKHLRARPIHILCKPAKGSGDEFWLREAYRRMRYDENKHPMAWASINVAKSWFQWIIDARNLLNANPLEDFRNPPPPPRVRTFTQAEIAALVQAADQLGYPSLGDAITLAFDLTWLQADLFSLTFGQIDDEWRMKHARIKTGVTGAPKVMPLGRARIAQIKARFEARTGRAPAAADRIIWAEVNAEGAWTTSSFHRVFREAMAQAAEQVGEDILTKTFRDLRDTGITFCARAGMTPQHIATRSLHTFAGVVRILKHYIDLDQDMADDASAKLEAYYATQPALVPANDEPIAA